jgi:hypothetical protein
MAKKKNRLEWFDGEIYPEGSIVINHLSGKSCYLNNEELSVYDYIKGIDALSYLFPKDVEPSDLYFKSLDWLRDNNNDAYATLFV